MSKKKVAKFGLTAAAAVTTVVAANPAGAAAASSVEQAVVQAEVSAKALTNFYGNTELTVTPEFEAAYNTAKKAIANAKALVASTTSNKAALEARVANAENLQTYAARYIDAVKIVAGELADATAPVADFVDAEEALDADAVENYHALSAAIKKAERTIGKVRGEAVREAFQEGFLLDAKLAREAIIFEVSQFELLEQINKDVEAGNLENVEADMAKLERLKERAVKIKEDGRKLYPNRTDVYPDVPAVEEALRATETAVTEAYEEQLTPAVESVSAINTKTLEVKFSKELTTEEQAAATYEVKVNGTVAPFKVESVAGASVKLVRTSALALESGDYEVTVKGLGEDQTKSLKVEAQKATSLEVTSSNLLDATATSKVGLELKDQYGTALTLNNSEFTATAYNVTKGTSVDVSWNSDKKSFVINTDTQEAKDFEVNDVVKVSFYHAKSGLSATKDLKVVTGAALSDVTFGSVELPSGKTLLTEDLTNVKVPVNAVDQYGNAVELVKDTNVVVVSSDESIVDPSDVTFISEGTPSVAKLKVAEFGGYGKVTLTLVNKTTGDAYSLPLEVKQEAGVISKVSLDKSTLEIAQDGSDVAIGLNVTDNYGSAIEAKDFADASAFTITTSNNTIADATIDNDPASEDYGKLIVSSIGEKGKKAVVTVTVNATGETAKLNVTIGEAAVPSSINVDEDSEHTTSLAVGASTTVDFEVFDQYANAVGGSESYSVVYSVKDAAEAITLEGADGDGLVADATEQDTSVTVNAAKAGSATLVAKLIKGEDEVIATKEVSFNVVANSGSKLSYSIGDIPTLYKAGSVAGADLTGGTDQDPTGVGTDANETITSEDIDAGYAKEIKLVAKDASGNTVAIPADQIVDITTSSSNIVISKVDNKYYVAGNNSALDEDTKATFSVVYNAEDGVKTLTKEVTVSKDALKVTSVKFMDKAVGTTSAKAITSLTVADKAALKSVEGFGDAFIWAQDQFGGYTLADTKEELNAALSIKAITGVTGATTDTIAVEDGINGDLVYTDTDGDLAITTDGAKVRVIANFAGVASSLDVVITSKDSAN